MPRCSTSGSLILELLTADLGLLIFSVAAGLALIHAILCNVVTSLPRECHHPI